MITRYAFNVKPNYAINRVLPHMSTLMGLPWEKVPIPWMTQPNVPTQAKNNDESVFVEMRFKRRLKIFKKLKLLKYPFELEHF